MPSALSARAKPFAALTFIDVSSIQAWFARYVTARATSCQIGRLLLQDEHASTERRGVDDGRCHRVDCQSSDRGIGQTRVDRGPAGAGVHALENARSGPR